MENWLSKQEEQAIKEAAIQRNERCKPGRIIVMKIAIVNIIDAIPYILFFNIFHASIGIFIVKIVCSVILFIGIKWMRYIIIYSIAITSTTICMPGICIAYHMEIAKYGVFKPGLEPLYFICFLIITVLNIISCILHLANKDIRIYYNTKN